MKLLAIKDITITEKGQISIPKVVRDRANFKKGSKLVLLAYNNHIELRPLSQIENNPALLSEKALAKYWNTKEEDEAWKDL